MWVVKEECSFETMVSKAQLAGCWFSVIHSSPVGNQRSSNRIVNKRMNKEVASYKRLEGRLQAWKQKNS